MSRAHAGTIRGRLRGGFGLLVALLLLIGVIARSSIGGAAETIRLTMAQVQQESALAAQLAATVAQEIDAANYYLAARDPTANVEFRRFGGEAHRVQRAMNNLVGQTAEEVALVAAIDERLSELEIHYALAHRLVDLARAEAAVAAVARARPIVGELLSDVAQVGQLKARKVSEASDELQRDARRRSFVVTMLIVVATLVAGYVVVRTGRSINSPLALLVAQAQRLSGGDLTVRTTAQMPDELQTLAQAMNQTGESLSMIVAGAARTADEVARSADELTTASGQISGAASEVAATMTDVATSAGRQVQQLQDIDGVLHALRGQADDVLARASQVSELAGGIEDVARAKRVEVARALSILMGTKSMVQDAAAEVVTLNATAAAINHFAETIEAIAQQTELLALNAAIEAARAGDAGRGFSVVAGEVRSLADQARTTVADVSDRTRALTSRVGASARAMELAASQVGEIESVSHAVDQALAEIFTAAGRTRDSGESVAGTAKENALIVARAAGNLGLVAKTAQDHAATAEEVNAASEEQSAACQQMNAAAATLLAGSIHLRDLVAGLKT